MSPPIAVIGGGAWGTALALAAARAGNAVRLWVRDPALAAAMQNQRCNRRYLPDIALPDAIEVCADPAFIGAANPVLVAVPAQHLRATLAPFAAIIAADARLIACTKGIEAQTLLLVPDLMRRLLPGRVQAMLSGPTFAQEVARGLPSAAILAADDLAEAQSLLARLAQPTLRLYASDDLSGAAAGGAVKNVLAIACGIASGKGFGDNARAALMTRGLAELLRFGIACGGHSETLMGLAGMGDLVLTCSALQSRNFALGVALGRGLSLPEALAASRGVAEGVATAPVLLACAARLGVEMPIAAAVAAVLSGNLDLEAAIAGLLARPAKREY